MKKLNESFSNSSLTNSIAFKTKAITRAGFANKGDTLDDLQEKYQKKESDNSNGRPTPKLTLHYYQKYYKADIVVAVIDNKNESLAGKALAVPNKTASISKTKTNLLSYGDYSIIFLNLKYKNMKEVIAHEIGHSFGLWHGKAVQKKLGSGNYSPKTAIKKYANGYGDTDWGNNFGTLMAGRYLTSVDKGIENKFSNPDSNKCGYYSNDERCGDSTANAVKFIKENAKYYNKRGDWYK